MQHTDSPAVPQVGEKNNVWVVGSATDMSKSAPTKQLTAIIDDWSHYYTERVEKKLNGNWKNDNTWGRFSKKMVDLAPFNQAITSDVRKKAKQLREEISARKFHPFTGPIFNNKGEKVAKAGQVLSDEYLLK